MHSPLMTPGELREAGCTCAFGCQRCGRHESEVDACVSVVPCPMGRNPRFECPLSADEVPCPGCGTPLSCVTAAACSRRVVVEEE